MRSSARAQLLSTIPMIVAGYPICWYVQDSEQGTVMANSDIICDRVRIGEASVQHARAHQKFT